VAARREEWESHATQSVPDTVIGSVEGTVDEGGRSDGSLRGLPISAGYAEGPVCLLLSPNDMKKVKRGDILVAPVIDPGMAPLMGLAQVLRDECGHSLGLGVVHMARTEDIERVFNANQRFEVLGSHVDLWEPTGPEDPQAERMVAYNLWETRAVETGQDRGHEKSQTALKPLAMPKRRLAQPPVPSSRTAKR
jgi:hypothetical protein